MLLGRSGAYGWATALILVGCHMAAPPGSAASPKSSSELAEAGLQNLIEDVPPRSSGQVSYDTIDNLGEQMGALDPIHDPAGGYVGVYHTPFGPRPGATAADFAMSLGYSADLIHWTRVRVIDSAGATMPTLRAIPGNPGFLLAYEKATPGDGNHIRVRYYRRFGDFLDDRIAAQIDLPRVFSGNSNGTPSLTFINWHGGLKKSVIGIDFHYETAIHHGPGPDREAEGALIGFRRWAVVRDEGTDALLDSNGLTGNHGDSRQFTFANNLWRVYEAQTSFNNFGTWHVLLYDVQTRTMHPLTMNLPGGQSVASFGNPIAQLEPAPHGPGRVLVVTMFIFNSPTLILPSGELIYYQTAPRS
jgi:hypothetical protein